MKKILLIIIIIYTSCNSPTSSTPDLPEAIVGNWYLYHKIEKTYLGNGAWKTVDETTGVGATSEIFVFKSDCTVSFYYRDNINSDFYKWNKFYFIQGDTLVIYDSTFIYHNVSIKEGVLYITYQNEDSTYLYDKDYKKNTGSITPEW